MNDKFVHMTFAERFVNAMRAFDDDEDLEAQICLSYMPYIKVLMWNPKGDDEHIIVFADSSGILFDLSGAMRTGSFPMDEDEDEDEDENEEDSLAHLHLRRIDATKRNTQERTDAAHAMFKDVIKTVGSLDEGILYLMKDMSSLIAIRKDGELTVAAKGAAATRKGLIAAATKLL